MIVRIQTDPIDPPSLLSGLGDIGAGAVASFTGLVRADDEVEALELEAYPGFTEREIEREASCVAEKKGLIGLVLVHRIGRMAPGEPVVFIAAAAVHRRAAFDAVDRLMDYLKTSAPLWKREHGAFGSRWIEPRPEDHADAARWRPLGACA